MDRQGGASADTPGDRLAGLHFRVERITRDESARLGTVVKQVGRAYLRMLGRRRPRWARIMDPAAGIQARDVVRIIDRAGGVVWEREIDDRFTSDRVSNELVEDLLRMEVDAFRAKYELAPTPPSDAP